MRRARTLLCAVAVVGILGAAAPATGVRHEEGKLSSGAAYVIDVPERWNGTLLLWSRGYSFTLPQPENAPREARDWLLAQGYALAGSAYSQPGWAVEQAVPDQIATIDRFAERFGKPKRTIAWGYSMGGLVTTALIERHPERFAAAMPMCASLAGSIGMLNEGLAGAFAFKQLLGEGSGIELVGVSDDRRNGELVIERVKSAMASPDGRARLALVATLAQFPHWVDAMAPEPQIDDDETVLTEQVKAFPSGTFLPRQDLERRAGGVFSWTEGVDFSALLRNSRRRGYVERMYAKAGLSLDADLAQLAAAVPVRADPAAVRYMEANYAPSGLLRVPMLAVHNVGDGITVPANMNAYAAATAQRGRSNNYRMATVRGAGHCIFRPAEIAAGLRALEGRLDGRGWQVTPSALNALAVKSGLGPARFSTNLRAPFLRPYVPAAGR